MLGFAGRSAKGAGATAAASLRPFLLGRQALDREAIWHDWRRADRWWHHLPIYSYGPVDCCLWILGAEAAGQPLWRYIGGARDQIRCYGSSLVLADAAAYAAEARAVQAAGMQGYKIHPPGRSLDEDIEIHRAVRSAVGDDFALMSDPVAALYAMTRRCVWGACWRRWAILWLEGAAARRGLRRAARTDPRAGHSGDRRRGAGQASLFGGRMHCARAWSTRCAPIRQLDRRRHRNPEDRPSGRGVPHELRIAHDHLSTRWNW